MARRNLIFDRGHTTKLKMKKSIVKHALAILAAVGALPFIAPAAPCNINMGVNQQTMDGFGFSTAFKYQLGYR